MLLTSARSIGQRYRPFLESAVLGGLLATVDLFTTEVSKWMLLAIVTLGVVEGCRHAGRAWTCWLPLGSCFYIFPVAAIAAGQKSPYVELTFLEARQCWLVALPIGFGFLVGVVSRVGLVMMGIGRRQDGPPVRLWPRTTQEILWWVAWVAFCLGFCRWLLFDSQTVYAPGFTEAKFAQVQIGQSTAEVRALLGPPLDGVHRNDDQAGPRWVFTTGVTHQSNYWRRWVYFDHDKVSTIVNDYWFD